LVLCGWIFLVHNSKNTTINCCYWNRI